MGCLVPNERERDLTNSIIIIIIYTITNKAKHNQQNKTPITNTHKLLEQIPLFLFSGPSFWCLFLAVSLPFGRVSLSLLGVVGREEFGGGVGGVARVSL